MPAYMVSLVTAHDMSWVPEYLEQVPPIVRRHGGEFLAVAKPGEVERLEGTASTPQSVVVFKFPSMAAIKGFLESSEYGPYKKARIAATDTDFFAFEHDPDAPQFKSQGDRAGVVDRGGRHRLRFPGI